MLPFDQPTIAKEDGVVGEKKTDTVGLLHVMVPEQETFPENCALILREIAANRMQ